MVFVYLMAASMTGAFGGIAATVAGHSPLGAVGISMLSGHLAFFTLAVWAAGREGPSG